MSIRVSFTAAASLVHKDEHLENIGMILWDGDLYFAGRKSEFVIRDFIQGAARIRLTYNDVQAILKIGDNVSVTMIDDGCASFANGRQNIRIPVHAASAHPTIGILEEDAYAPIKDVYKAASPVFNITTDHTHVNALENDGSPCIVAFDQNFLAVTFGEINSEMSMTDIPEVIKKAVAHKADVAFRDSRIYFRALVDGQWVYAVSVVTKPIVTSVQMDFLRKLSARDFGRGDFVTAKVAGKDMLGAMQLVESLDTDPRVEYHFKKSEIVVVGNDKNSRRFTSTIENVESSAEIKTLMHSISRSMLTFVGSPHGGIDKSRFIFTLNVTESRMYIEAEPLKGDSSALRTVYMMGVKRV